MAAILGESPALGANAAELVVIDHEPLPAAVDLVEAAGDGPFLFPELESNVAAAIPGTEDEEFFRDCDVVIEADLCNHRISVAPLEGRVTAAKWDEQGRPTFSIASQVRQRPRQSSPHYSTSNAARYV